MSTGARALNNPVGMVQTAPLNVARTLLVGAVVGLTGLQVVALVLNGVAGTGEGFASICALVMIAGWAVATHRLGHSSGLADAVPFLGLHIHAVSAGTAQAALATAVVLVLFRAVHETRLSSTVLAGLLYAVALVGAAAYHVDSADQTLQVVATIVDLAALPALALIMGMVAAALSERERAAARATVLHKAGQQFVLARRPEDVERALVTAVRSLGEINNSLVAALWRFGEDALEFVEPSQWRETPDRLPVHLLRKETVAGLRSGHPFSYVGTQASEAQLSSLDFSPTVPLQPAVVLAPMNVSGRRAAVAVVSCVVEEVDDVSQVLAQLCREAGLAMERAELVAELARNEERFRGIVNNSSDVIAIIDLEGSFTLLSPSVRNVFGYGAEELLGRNVVEFIHSSDAHAIERLINPSTERRQKSPVIECRLRHADEVWRHVEISSSGMRDDAGVAGIVLNVRDISDRKAMESELTFRAFHDPLTELANRTLFEQHVSASIERSARNGRGIAVAFIDLDDFKAINDSLGHGAGDELLRGVAERLDRELRSGDIAARLGGDEFALLLEDVDSIDAVKVVQRVIRSLDAPFVIAGHDIVARLSVGVATGGLDDATSEELLRNADLAMYVAKHGGKGRIEVFDPSMHSASVERLELRVALEGALRRGEFALHFQPAMRLEDNTPVLLEALVRWEHPQRGLLPPLEFLGHAEETGMIVPLGRWILTEACRQATTWPLLPGGRGLGLAVNVSIREFIEAGFIQSVTAALEETGLEPERLVLELTEHMLIEDLSAARGILEQIRELGVRIAIDDFGTGYSALGYLRQLPVDIIKVDRSLIDCVDEDAEGAAVAHAVIQLAQDLGLRTVAEGIERAEQLVPLVQWACELGQGYLHARPMPAVEVAGFLRERGCLPYAPAAAESTEAAPAAEHTDQLLRSS